MAEAGLAEALDIADNTFEGSAEKIHRLLSVAVEEPALSFGEPVAWLEQRPLGIAANEEGRNGNRVDEGERLFR